MAKPTKKKILTLYAVGAVEKDHAIDMFGKEHKLDLTWADGMIGVMPVFDNEAAAKEYADGKFEILRIKVIEGETTR